MTLTKAAKSDLSEATIDYIETWAKPSGRKWVSVQGDSSTSSIDDEITQKYGMCEVSDSGSRYWLISSTEFCDSGA